MIKFKSLIKTLALTTILLLLSGCGSTDDQSRSLTLVEEIETLTQNLLTGYKDIIVTGENDGESDGNYKKTLNILQKDSQTDNLLLLNSVYLGVANLYTPISSISLNSKWATVIMSGTYGGDESFISLVDLQNNDISSLSLVLNFQQIIEHAIANDNYLLLSFANEVAIYDISDLSNPILENTYVSNGSISSIVGITDGFYAINSQGLVYVNYSDNSNISFTEIVDTDIKESEKVYVYGDYMYIAGNSKYQGQSKIAKVDISIPSSPNVLLINDTINGLSDNYNVYETFSYDFSSGKYYLALTHEVHQYIESNGGLSMSNSSQLLGLENFNYIYAWNNYLYVDDYFLSVYKFK